MRVERKAMNRFIRMLRFCLARLDSWLDAKTGIGRTVHERVLIQAAMTAGGKLRVDTEYGELAKEPMIIAMIGGGMVEVGIVSSDGKTVTEWKP